MYTCENWLHATEADQLMFCPTWQTVSLRIGLKEEQEAKQTAMDAKLAEQWQKVKYEEADS